MNDGAVRSPPRSFWVFGVPCRPFTAMLYEGWCRKFDNFNRGYLGSPTQSMYDR